MLGRQKRYYRTCSFLLDAVAAIACLEIVYLALLYASPLWQRWLTEITGYPFNFQGVTHLTEQGWLFTVILLCLFLSLWSNRFYSIDYFAGRRKIVFAAAKSTLVGLGLVTVFFYFFSIINVNRSLLFGFYALFGAYLVTKELLFRHFVIQRRFQKRPLRALLLCPEAERSALQNRFAQRDHASVQLTHTMTSVAGLADTLSTGGYDLVLLGNHPDAQRAIEVAEEQGVEVWYRADFLSPLLARPEFDEFGGAPIVIFSTVPHYEGKFFYKRAFDVIAALGLLLLLSPLLAVIGLLVKLSSRGPIIFKQQRTGWRGRPFFMWKFRTMIADAEAQRDALNAANEIQGPAFKLAQDPRITPFGRWLRRYSLDELPQLWNILRGDMSLVGPRPLPLKETENFSAFRDRRRLSVLPGLTGLWQVSGRSDIKDFAEWVRLDLEYIDRWSFWLDVRILCKTLPTVLSGQGAH
ncbi:sugar transferase [Cerasicoccus frondis]|uniref:sugar transferase n=1 Tax=Cerasicoccus frondis TaxID=490090 RepID=UPI002852B65A|nr:sugar transferase [Cerasicoccus frondis]